MALWMSPFHVSNTAYAQVRTPRYKKTKKNVPERANPPSILVDVPLFGVVFRSIAYHFDAEVP